MNFTPDSTAGVAKTSKMKVAKSVGNFVVHWVYPVTLALTTLSIVIVTLAAYQFQAQITGIEPPKADASVKAEIAGDLLALQADYRVFRRHADDQWALYLEAEQRVSDELRPQLHALTRKERIRESPWLEPRPSADTDSGAGQATPISQPAAASETPVSSDTQNAALASAIESYREYLRYEKLIHQLIPNKDEKAYLSTPYSELLYFTNFKLFTLGFLDPMAFAVMPSCMLTLIVTLAMGALGSCLLVLRTCVDETCDGGNKYHPASWFFLRPLLGVGTAFLIFVFLKAGLTLTAGNLTQGNINPFFIAVVAGLAGLMSWQALESIERWGARLFGEAEASQERWAYGLRGAFQMNQDKTPDALAAFLREDRSLVELWMAEERRVPQNIQDKIADWFATDWRHLFSVAK
jgi:hypothetical protein